MSYFQCESNLIIPARPEYRKLSVFKRKCLLYLSKFGVNTFQIWILSAKTMFHLRAFQKQNEPIFRSNKLDKSYGFPKYWKKSIREKQISKT